MQNIPADSQLRNKKVQIDVSDYSCKCSQELSASCHVTSIEEPYRIIRQGLLVVFLFFVVLGVWSVIGTITGAVVSPGKVKIDRERKTVQHLEGGIVEEILVREGEHVEQGQNLIILESVQIDSSVVMLGKRLMTNLAVQARCNAQKNFDKTIFWPNELLLLVKKYGISDIINSQEKIFNASIETYYGQVSLLESQILQVAAQIDGYKEQIVAEQKIINTLHEEIGAKRQLYEKKYLEKSQILELERQRASHEGRRANLKQLIAEAYQKRDEFKLRIKDTTARFVEQISNELGTIEKDILQTREQIRPLQDAKKRLHVVAPVSGRIVNLKVHSKGGVIGARDGLMDIVPDDTPLLIETQIPVEKITDIYLKQEAQVQMDAFDRRTTPLIKGTVIYISADRLEEQTNMGITPYYLCYVEVSPQFLQDANVYFSPGMPVTVFITTKNKPVISYIIEPILKSWDRALRD